MAENDVRDLRAADGEFDASKYSNNPLHNPFPQEIRFVRREYMIARLSDYCSANNIANSDRIRNLIGDENLENITDENELYYRILSGLYFGNTYLASDPPRDFATVKRQVDGHPMGPGKNNDLPSLETLRKELGDMQRAGQIPITTYTKPLSHDSRVRNIVFTVKGELGQSDGSSFIVVNAVHGEGDQPILAKNYASAVKQFFDIRTNSLLSNDILNQTLLRSDIVGVSENDKTEAQRRYDERHSFDTFAEDVSFNTNRNAGYRRMVQEAAFAKIFGQYMHETKVLGDNLTIEDGWAIHDLMEKHGAFGRIDRPTFLNNCRNAFVEYFGEDAVNALGPNFFRDSYMLPSEWPKAKCDGSIYAETLIPISPFDKRFRDREFVMNNGSLRYIPEDRFIREMSGNSDVIKDQAPDYPLRDAPLDRFNYDGFSHIANTSYYPGYYIRNVNREPIRLYHFDNDSGVYTAACRNVISRDREYLMSPCDVLGVSPIFKRMRTDERNRIAEHVFGRRVDEFFFSPKLKAKLLTFHKMVRGIPNNYREVDRFHSVVEQRVNAISKTLSDLNKSFTVKKETYLGTNSGQLMFSVDDTDVSIRVLDDNYKYIGRAYVGGPTNVVLYMGTTNSKNDGGVNYSVVSPEACSEIVKIALGQGDINTPYASDVYRTKESFVRLLNEDVNGKPLRVYTTSTEANTVPTKVEFGKDEAVDYIRGMIERAHANYEAVIDVDALVDFVVNADPDEELDIATFDYSSEEGIRSIQRKYLQYLTGEERALYPPDVDAKRDAEARKYLDGTPDALDEQDDEEEFDIDEDDSSDIDSVSTIKVDERTVDPETGAYLAGTSGDEIRDKLVAIRNHLRDTADYNIGVDMTNDPDGPWSFNGTWDGQWSFNPMTVAHWGCADAGDFRGRQELGNAIKSLNRHSLNEPEPRVAIPPEALVSHSAKSQINGFKDSLLEFDPSSRQLISDLAVNNEFIKSVQETIEDSAGSSGLMLLRVGKDGRFSLPTSGSNREAKGNANSLVDFNSKNDSTSPAIWIDENGVVKYMFAYKTGSDKGKQKIFVSSGYIGQIFVPEADGSFRSKFLTSEDRTYFPGYKATVLANGDVYNGEKDIERPLRMNERIRLHGYTQDMLEAIRHNVAVNTLSLHDPTDGPVSKFVDYDIANAISEINSAAGSRGQITVEDFQCIPVGTSTNLSREVYSSLYAEKQNDEYIEAHKEQISIPGVGYDRLLDMRERLIAYRDDDDFTNRFNARLTTDLRPDFAQFSRNDLLRLRDQLVAYVDNDDFARRFNDAIAAAQDDAQFSSVISDYAAEVFNFSSLTPETIMLNKDAFVAYIDDESLKTIVNLAVEDGFREGVEEYAGEVFDFSRHLGYTSRIKFPKEYADGASTHNENVMSGGIAEGWQGALRVAGRTMCDDPHARAGEKDIGVFSSEEDRKFYARAQTSAGASQGSQRYLNRNASVDLANGSITASKVEGDDGPLGLFLRDVLGLKTNGNPVDRMAMSCSNTITASDINANTNIASFSCGYNMDDGQPTSTAFQRTVKAIGSDGQRRDLVVGDKISNACGNKGTIPAIIDPAMTYTEAIEKGIDLNVLHFVQSNTGYVRNAQGDVISDKDGKPIIDQRNSVHVIDSPFSIISRFQGGQLRDRVYNANNPPRNAHVPPMYDSEGRWVSSPRTAYGGIATEPYIVTKHAADVKTHTYATEADSTEAISGKGRSLSMSVANAIGSKYSSPAARLLTDRQRNAIMNETLGHNTAALNKLRAHFIVLGIDIDEKGNLKPSYHAHNGEYRPVLEISETDVMSKVLPTVVASINNKTDLIKRSVSQSLFEDMIRKSGNGSMKGAFISLPFPIKLASGNDCLPIAENGVDIAGEGEATNGKYALPFLDYAYRTGQTFDEDILVPHDYTNFYKNIVHAAVNYSAIQSSIDSLELSLTQLKGAGDVERAEAQIGILREKQERYVNMAQSQYDRIAEDIQTRHIESKKNLVREGLMKCRIENSSTAVLTASPSLDVNAMGMSPEMALQLKLAEEAVDENGNRVIRAAKEEGSDRPKSVLTWRDPVLRSAGIRCMRPNLTPGLKGVSIAPESAKCFDADFDGDTLGIVSLNSAEAREEAEILFSFETNMLDIGSGPDDKGNYSLFFNDGLDIAVARYMSPEISDRYDDLTISVNEYERAFDKFTSDLSSLSYFGGNGMSYQTLYNDFLKMKLAHGDTVSVGGTNFVPSIDRASGRIVVNGVTLGELSLPDGTLRDSESNGFPLYIFNDADEHSVDSIKRKFWRLSLEQRTDFTRAISDCSKDALHKASFGVNLSYSAPSFEPVEGTDKLSEDAVGYIMSLYDTFSASARHSIEKGADASVEIERLRRQFNNYCSYVGIESNGVDLYQLVTDRRKAFAESLGIDFTNSDDMGLTIYQELMARNGLAGVGRDFRNPDNEINVRIKAIEDQVTSTMSSINQSICDEFRSATIAKGFQSEEFNADYKKIDPNMLSAMLSIKAVCLDTGAKGSASKFEDVAKYVGLTDATGRGVKVFDLIQNGDFSFIGDHGKSLMTASDDCNTQYATHVKAQGTGVAGKFTQRGLVAFRNMDAASVQELTYFFTQMVLQIKHEPQKAAKVYGTLMGPARKLWDGYAVTKDSDGRYVVSDQLATKEDWINSFRMIYEDNDISFNDEHMMHIVNAMSATYDELSADGTQVVRTEHMQNLVDDKSAPCISVLDDLAYNNGKDFLKSICALAETESNIYAGYIPADGEQANERVSNATLLFAPKVIQDNLHIDDTSKLKNFGSASKKSGMVIAPRSGYSVEDIISPDLQRTLVDYSNSGQPVDADNPAIKQAAAAFIASQTVCNDYKAALSDLKTHLQLMIRDEQALDVVSGPNYRGRITADDILRESRYGGCVRDGERSLYGISDSISDKNEDANISSRAAFYYMANYGAIDRDGVQKPLASSNADYKLSLLLRSHSVCQSLMADIVTTTNQYGEERSTRKARTDKDMISSLSKDSSGKGKQVGQCLCKSDQTLAFVTNIGAQDVANITQKNAAWINGFSSEVRDAIAMTVVGMAHGKVKMPRTYQSVMREHTLQPKMQQTFAPSPLSVQVSVTPKVVTPSVSQQSVAKAPARRQMPGRARAQSTTARQMPGRQMPNRAPVVADQQIQDARDFDPIDYSQEVASTSQAGMQSGRGYDYSNVPTEPKSSPDDAPFDLDDGSGKPNNSGSGSPNFE